MPPGGRWSSPEPVSSRGSGPGRWITARRMCVGGCARRSGKRIEPSIGRRTTPGRSCARFAVQMASPAYATGLRVCCRFSMPTRKTGCEGRPGISWLGATAQCAGRPRTVRFGSVTSAPWKGTHPSFKLPATQVLAERVLGCRKTYRLRGGRPGKLSRDRLQPGRGHRLSALRFLQRRHVHGAMPAAAGRLPGAAGPRP